MNTKRMQMTTKMVSFLIVVMFLVGMCQSAAVAATKPRIVFTLGRAEDHPDTIWAKFLFTEAFQRLGMEFVYKSYPLKRGTAMADEE